jgi:hypothetical protein
MSNFGWASGHWGDLVGSGPRRAEQVVDASDGNDFATKGDTLGLGATYES